MTIVATAPLGFPWQTLDPFLFAVHHLDAYPAGDERLAPVASLAGRDLGNDFTVKDGFRMYHGHVVPGFPQHPHRGFETVTVVRRGLIDHSDSLGATARFGAGDAQWLTAGRGISHAEMFPLVEPDRPNPLELFQIWLNLPRRNKMVAPYFSMLWRERVPRVELPGARVTVVAGAYGDAVPLAPPPDSWASQADADVAIWTVELDPGARVTLPPARPGSNRVLYFFSGATLRVGGRTVEPSAVQVRADAAVELENGPATADLLVLQGRPIGEPVAQQGPFVMTSAAEVEQAFADYRRTRFGGWPWPKSDPVHERTAGRFARHPDGRLDRPLAPAASADAPINS
jgi:redox-sensitive bicupin YhaK (pirin superfamily)